MKYYADNGWDLNGVLAEFTKAQDQIAVTAGRDNCFKTSNFLISVFLGVIQSSNKQITATPTRVAAIIKVL